MEGLPDEALKQVAAYFQALSEPTRLRIDGSTAVANGSHGISGTGANDVIIGSSLPGDGNLISGNGGNGLNFSAVPDVWKVRGNWIGRRRAGRCSRWLLIRQVMR